MKTKLLLLSMLFTASSIFAQSIGIIGDFSNWDNDVDMNTSDNITYTITNYYLPNTGLKFRQDNSWDNNWGGDTFPSGTTSGNNIPVTSGFYDISFNINTGAYSFTSVTGTDQNVSLIGDFNSWSDTGLSTLDNVTYTGSGLAITAGNVKFRRDGSWDVNYGNGGGGLSGTAAVNGADIAITDGNYDVSINIQTLAYSLTWVSTLNVHKVDISENLYCIDGRVSPNK